MAAYLVTSIFVIVIIYGLERNRRRQSQPSSRLAGSSDVQDRDTERTRAELRARWSGSGRFAA